LYESYWPDISTDAPVLALEEHILDREHVVELNSNLGRGEKVLQHSYPLTCSACAHCSNFSNMLSTVLRMMESSGSVET
jgi:hypothetical protein